MSDFNLLWNHSNSLMSISWIVEAYSWECNLEEASDFSFSKKTNSSKFAFVEDVNSWERASNKYHENWANTKSNDSKFKKSRKLVPRTTVKLIFARFAYQTKESATNNPLCRKCILQLKKKATMIVCISMHCYKSYGDYRILKKY